ncbi:ABC transporter ATP-binding protein [Aestuariimicrobium sp. T2.26MG-19.2B]|uniref:ABC transporter ATP-binding protein n=1 Tax=Aestuariimicrobium sp. T2.26MG-19.2B TaxID=3040679 RepID=UPI00247750DD|nr:ABC transporter ATP-binding protein [Aestuariimicrobium sp. T2.26MG-19.2B]CAI9402634.1 Multidrug efflux ATP-binding/permease protein [Aestuariimicrobium sp. T2.26MG-19.2B]
MTDTQQQRKQRDRRDRSDGRDRTDGRDRALDLNQELDHDTDFDWRGVMDEASDDPRDTPGRRSLKIQESARALLWDLMRPYVKFLPLLVVAVLVENVARLSSPWLVSRGIDRGVPPLMHEGSATVLIEVLVAMGVAVLLQAASRIIFLRLSGRFGQNMLLELRRRVFRHFQKLDVGFHDKYTSGRAVSRMTSDMDAIAELLAGGFDGLVTAVLTMIGVSIMLLVLDWKLGLICLTSLVFVSVLVRWFSVASRRTYRFVREASAMTIVQFVESMTGIKAVQAYRREPRNQQLFTQLSDRYRKVNTDAFRNVAIFMPGIRLIGNVAVGVVLLVGGYFVMHGEMTVGVLAAFLLYLRQFFEPMQEISQFYNTFQSANSALEKLSGVLDEQPRVREPQHPTALAAARGELDLDHVAFHYVEGVPVIPDLDLHVPAGQTIALVGTTGAGKTTIAKLVSRFYDPTGGRVRLDGVDLRELGDRDLRRAVTMVTQENFMFDGTIADNIGFGRPEATREQVVEAAKAVGAHGFITAMPKGYDTDVEKRGGRLSAGQRQLVAFARAFLADPAVLILDEATSSLDIPSERLVQQALQTILADRTAIIIAHRLSTVEIADRVLVLEHGRVLEDGSPEQLTDTSGGRYAALHQAWVESLA